MFPMPRWAAYLFWIWFFVSLVILVWRRVNARRAPASANDSIEASSPGPRSASSTAPLATSTAPAEKVWPAPPPPDPDDDTYRMDPAERGHQPAAAAPTAAGDPAPRASDESGPALVGSAPRATLPELLAGITLPHELVPLTQGDVAVDLATHVVVTTDKASAEQVTGSMCSELEKLGYDIDRQSMLTLRATGPRGAVRVEVHPDGAAVLDGSLRRFPTAREGSVVVELWAD